jgi:hypothetical protein
MKDVIGVKIVAATEDLDGTARFLDGLTPLDSGSGSGSCKVWRFEADAHLPGSIGGVPPENRFTGPGGATFCVICFPPHFMGATAEEMRRNNPSVQLAGGDDPEMHSTDSIDMGFIMSGKVDLRLPGEQVRTLEAGNAFVVAGARHAWRNPYDEPCVFSNVVVGVRRA